MNITGKQLLEIGLKQGKEVGIAKDLLSAVPAENSIATMNKLQEVILNPETFLENEQFAALAAELTRVDERTEIPLLDVCKPHKIYGIEGIEDGALGQLDTAMRLPVAHSGALMPDAHQGYGLPIGGVLATTNAIVPYAVGVDIGCRMCLSIFDLPATMIDEESSKLKKMLKMNTAFGKATMKKPREHEVIDHPLFNEIELLQNLKSRAFRQLGSSGGGNHFVEFGIAEITDLENELDLPPGKYLALLSHSGSRGFGATIASHYTKLAMETCKLPGEAKHLAWLDMDSAEGQEYWLAMNLAGDYASACHHQIHERIAVGLRTKPIAMVENHHNFAWKEKASDGSDVYVHRKGATPASKGVLGIIPGSMTAPGFIVRGKGNPESLNSAAHGAGRLMSRTTAKKNLDLQDVRNHLDQHNVSVIGSGLDEAPMAYKNIHNVMNAQRDLVETVGTFLPKIVRMCGDKSFHEAD